MLNSPITPSKYNPANNQHIFQIDSNVQITEQVKADNEIANILKLGVHMLCGVHLQKRGATAQLQKSKWSESFKKLRVCGPCPKSLYVYQFIVYKQIE